MPELPRDWQLPIRQSGQEMKSRRLDGRFGLCIIFTVCGQCFQISPRLGPRAKPEGATDQSLQFVSFKVILQTICWFVVPPQKKTHKKKCHFALSPKETKRNANLRVHGLLFFFIVVLMTNKNCFHPGCLPLIRLNFITSHQD